MKLHVPDFAAARVLVVGDLMLDRYWQGTTARISPEAPVPVVRVTESQERPGGAGNVALNIAALGAQARVDGLVGDDANAHGLTAFLKTAGVDCVFTPVPGLTTIVKLRVLSKHQQLLRLDFEDSFYAHPPHALLERFKRLLSGADVVVLSDYAKGTLAAAPELIAQARAAGKIVLVDPKGVDFERYRGATLLTPNSAEFTAIVGTCHDDTELVSKGQQLLRHLQLDALLITRGEHGMTLLQREHAPVFWPAQAREVFDVTGAGDTVIGVLASALAAGMALPEATALANVAAGIVVGKLGAATVSPLELRAAIAAQDSSARDIPTGVLDETQLLTWVQHAKANGEKIVMTNGCFDILHAGHVAYLQQARALGDRLIVAVNDDASVNRLKGAPRPINPLAQRMAVLAGLRAVDWVVPFSADTPESLICRVLPDVLVKGGDYQVEDIAGHRCVLDAGGDVKILHFVPGVSTTGMINRVLGN